MKKGSYPAVLTHSENSKNSPVDRTTGVFTLFAAAYTDSGVVPVKLKVKEYSLSGQSIPEAVKEYIQKAEKEPNTYAKVYDGRVLVLESIEKEDASSSALSATNDVIADKHPSAPSTISIKELIGLVNGEYQKYLPKAIETQTSTSANEVAKEIESTGSAQFSMRTWSQEGRAALEAERVKREILNISEPKFSISEPTEPAEQTAEKEKPRSFAQYPKKAQNAIKRTERWITNQLANILSVPPAAKRDSLAGIARQITDTYLEKGVIPSDKADEMFETAYNEGIVVDDEFYRTYKHVKDYLRKTPVVLRAEYRSDMGDYDTFRKSAFGVLNLNQAATRGIDQVYLDLIDMAPELFPESITHPADRLQRMYDVAMSIRKVEKTLNEVHGSYAKDFKEWARYEFRAKLQDYTAPVEDRYKSVPTHSPEGLAYTELERSGIASGASKDTIEIAKRISGITKRRILFYDGNTVSGDWARANGAYANDTIYVNSRSENP